MQLSELFEEKVGVKTLQEIFFYQTALRTDKISVERGLNFVGQNIFRRLRNFDGKEEIEYFFEDTEPNENFYELMEFWEVAEGCISVLPKDAMKRSRRLFSLVYEADAIYHSLQYDKLIERMGVEFEDQVEELCLRIEEIYNNKFIKILDFDMQEYWQASLREFEKFINGMEYRYVKLCLANVMMSGGIAVVVAGSEGLTPKRLHGYELQNNTWSVCPTEKLEPYREMLLADNDDAISMGSLRGINNL